MEQLNKVSQDNKLPKKAYKKKVQQSQAYATKTKTSSWNVSSKTNKITQNQAGRNKKIVTKQLKPLYTISQQAG